MAAKPIGSLYASLGLDSSQFDAGITKAQKRVQSFGDFKFGRGLKGGIDGIEDGLRGLAGRAGIAGTALAAAGLAGAATAAAFVGLAAALTKARDAMAFADEIGDTASKLAVTTDALQEYRYAVHQLGGEYTDADAALEKFSKAFGAAHAQLTKRAAKPFEALGLDAQSFDDTEDALQAVIEKIAALESTAEQAAIADKLGLTAMLPAIRAGVDEMERLRLAAHNVGYVMDADLIAKAGEANDKFEDLQQIIAVQLHSAFVDLAPLVLEITQAFADAARSLRGWTVNPKAIASLRLAAGYAAAIGKGGMLGGLNWLREHQGDIIQLQKTPDNVDWSKFESPDRTFKTKADRAGTALLPPSAGGGGGKRDRSAEALADLEIRELNARMALTENVERVAEMKSRQVDIETAMANRAVAEDAAEGTITAAAAKIAIAKNNELADLEKQKIAREAMAQLVAQEFAHREAIAADLDRAADLEAEYAATAAERNRLEAASLASRQKREREQLEEDLKRQLQADAISESGAAERRAAQADRQAAERKAQARKEQARLIEEETDLATSALRKQQDQLAALSMVAKSTYARAVIEAKILKLRQKEERRLAQAALAKTVPGSADERAARDRIEGLEELHRAEQQVADESTSLASAIQSATDDIRWMGEAFRRHDWGGALQDLERVIETVAARMGEGSGLGAQLGKFGKIIGQIGTYAQVGSVLADMVGGRQNTGSQVGAVIGSAIGTAIAGPIGGIIGSFLGNIAGGAIGGKPSNHASVAQISGGSVRLVSTGKETEETQRAAAGAANAIIAGEKLLREAGVTLAQTVHAVDLGQRDKTRIVLSDGTEFRTNAVGDPTEAADAALRRLLQNAAYADEALKQLVESAIAAGKSFDDIAVILQAQKVGEQLADQILQLTDPKAFEVKQVKTGIQQERDAAKALFDQGALTADQLAAINGQLSTLEGLQLDEVMKRFAESTDNATRKLEEWLASLTGQLTGKQSKAQAFAALQAAGLDARSGDKEALGKIPELGNAFIEAAKGSASSAFEVAQAIALARAIGSSALLAATNPAGLTPTSAMSADNSPAINNASSQLVTPDGEADASAPGGDLAALKAEIVSLREEVRAAATTLAGNSSATKKLLDRWDGEGLPAERAS